MSRDFTIKSYRKLLDRFLAQGYRTGTIEEYLSGQSPDGKLLLLRHDVDKRPQQALIMAVLEHEAGAKGTYYFRNVPQSLDPRVVKMIKDLGHEIGYHYEDLAKADGDLSGAVELFHQNLARLREFYPVRTICMHGSPRSSFDNLRLLDALDLEKEGLLGDPYTHIDRDEFLYLTDTGGRWDDEASSIRDEGDGSKYGIRTSFQLMEAIEAGKLPDRILMTLHPQRWIDERGLWSWEQGTQWIKNRIKRSLKTRR